MNEIAGNKYKLDINKEDLINSYVNEWVLEWCREYHPETFEKANQFVEEYLNESE
jgi:hypothetical protein